MSVRLSVRVAAVLTLVASALVVDVAPATAVKVPRTLVHVTPVSQEAVEPGFPVDYVGVLWTGEHADAVVRFRHQGRWGPWLPAGEDGAHVEGQFASALVAGRDAEAYQVQAPGGVAARAVAINTTDGPLVTLARTPSARADASEPLDDVEVVSRAAWGADESLRFDSDGTEIWPKTFADVQKLTVHHTATDNADPDPAATVRAIYRYHAVDRGWGDIGYQFLVDEGGQVYEGRHTDDDPATPAALQRTVDATTGETSYSGVTGAHVGGWNTGNIGVAALGTLTDQRPTAGAQRGVERILASLASRTEIDPLGSDTYVNAASGETWDGPNIPGHQDFTATECPGGTAYALLPTVRPRVAERVAGTLAEDFTAPTISGLGASAVKSATARITWATAGDPSDSQVRYWVKSSSSVKVASLDLRFVEDHAVDLSGLRRRTTYEYRVLSADVAGNLTTSAVGTFRTTK